MSIWNCKPIKKTVTTNELLSLDEGNTPVDVIENDDNRIFVKREDKNPTGSWKDRGTAYKITLLKQKNIKEAVISSSGNAAISYLTYSRLYPQLKLHIIVSPHVDKSKLEKIKELTSNTHHELHVSSKPKTKRAEIIAATKAYSLAASTDSEIVKGYWSLGIEIGKLMKKESKDGNKDFSLFCPVSSGTALVGIMEGIFIETEDEYFLPKVFVCQTTNAHPIVDLVDGKTINEEENLADAIIEKTCLRSPQILKIINQTDGDALAICNAELEKAKEFMSEKERAELSYTSLLSIAGYSRIFKQNLLGTNSQSPITNHKIICIASGR